MSTSRFNAKHPVKEEADFTAPSMVFVMTIAISDHIVPTYSSLVAAHAASVELVRVILEPRHCDSVIPSKTYSMSHTRSKKNLPRMTIYESSITDSICNMESSVLRHW